MRRTLLGGLALAGIAFACSGDSVSGLVLGLQLDLVVPEDTDHVAVLVSLIQNGQRTNQPPAELQPIDHSRVTFVATLVLESRDPSDVVQVRFVAFDAAGKVRAMREARTAVPATGTKLLKMPLLWINDGLVQDSGSGPLSATGAGDLQLQNDNLTVQSLTDDVFNRLSEGCPAPEQTRGNDGLCRSIDVRADELVDLHGDVTVEAHACFDLDRCVSGEQVRVFDLATLQGCRLPIDTVALTEKPALVLTGPSTGGYKQTQGPLTSLRPIDDQLYAYEPETHSIVLGEALCAKVGRDRIPTALVSAKCSPKQTDNPVCEAAQQTSNGRVDPGPGIFTGGDAGQPLDDGGNLPDTGPEPDTGPPPALPIERTVTIPAGNVDSFAVRGGEHGVIWIMAQPYEGSSTALFSRWDSTALPLPTDHDGGYPNGQVMIGANERAYLVLDYQAAGSTNTLHFGLGNGHETAETVRVCEPGGCASGSECPNQVAPNFFTVAEATGGTVGLFARNINDTVNVGFGLTVPPIGTPGCFEYRAPATDAGSTYFLTGKPQRFYPGAAVGEAMVAGLDVTSPSSQLVYTAPAGSGTDSGAMGQLVAAFGENRGLVAQPAASATTFRTIDPSLASAGAAASFPYDTLDELFGGPNVACMRARAVSPARQVPLEILCVQATGNLLQTTSLALDGVHRGELFDLFDPHVYADASYLYVGQACTATSFAIRGVPWARLQTQSELQQAFDNLCGGDEDAGPT